MSVSGDEVPTHIVQWRDFTILSNVGDFSNTAK